MSEELKKDYNLIAEKFIKSNFVVILTGAGVSAESGVPTFRDALTGLWEKYNPEELATPYAFRENPELVWSWYCWRKELILKTKPNPGHYAIKEMEELKNDFILITQNVDGLHKDSGNKKILEMHGNIFRSRCFNNCVVLENVKDKKPVKCEKCGDYIRPDVVWFGEEIPQNILNKISDCLDKCDLFFCVGTSGLVQPAATFPVIAKNKGAFLIEININPTSITDYSDVFLKGKSGEILPAIIKIIKTYKLL